MPESFSRPASFERLAYEFEEIWDEEWFTGEDYERVKCIAELIPNDAETLLDVGCGSGLFLNHLKKGYQSRFKSLVGIDRSEAALARVQTDRKLCDIDSLPFPGLQFDAVTCLEVLEHLPVAIYPKGLAEIARVAKRYIIVSVPLNENIKAGHCECPICGTSFSPDYHIRSFNEDSLRPLFCAHSFQMTGTHFLAQRIARYDHELRNRFRGMFRRNNARTSFPSYAICPVCGYHNRHELSADLFSRKRQRRKEPRSEPPVSIGRRLLRWALPKRVDHRWIVATYERIRSQQ